MLLCRSIVSWISRIVDCMGGCLGCCAKPTPIIAVDEPTKGLKIQGRTVKNPSISDDFWSTSTYEMDNSAVQSQRSMSSISASCQTTLDHHGTGSTSAPSEFVNHGFLLWNQTRQQWSANKKRSDNRIRQVQEPNLSWNATYESLLGTNKRFAQPIPLSLDAWSESRETSLTFLVDTGSLINKSPKPLPLSLNDVPFFKFFSLRRGNTRDNGNGRFSGGYMGAGGHV